MKKSQNVRNLAVVLALGLSITAACESKDSGGGSGSGGDAAGGGSGGDNGGNTGGSGSGGSKTGGSGSGGATAGGSIAIADFGTTLAANICKIAWGCCADTAAMNKLNSTSETGCRVTRGAQFKGAVKPLTDSQAAGKIKYDGELLKQCEDRKLALDCDATQAEVDAAFGPCAYLTPLVAVGGDCLNSHDCIDGYCGTDKKCAAFKAEQATCANGGECLSKTCTMTKCVAAPAPVEPAPGICGTVL